MNDPHSSIQKLVSVNSLNKRKNLRIKYPHFGAFGPYPKVFYKDTEMIVANIGVGGMLIIDDTERFGQNVGEVIMLQLAWPDTTAKVRARVVGANQHRRHLQFVDFNAQAFLKISALSKPAYLGTRFHRVRDDSGRLNSLELWLGPTNENLSFYNDGPFAELTMPDGKYTFQKGSATICHKTGAPAGVGFLSDLVVMLANFPEGSSRIKSLIEILDSEIRSVSQSPRTGTHG